MRRAVPAAIATLVGLIALLSFKSSPGTSSAATVKLPRPKSRPAATAPPRRTTTTTPATTAPRSTTPATGTSPATNPPQTNPPQTTPTTASTAVRTIDGDPFDNQYGTVQVRVTLRGNTITNVTALQMPFEHQRSAEISQQAAPLLLQEVLQAQSAQIDTLGGATYTSESYAQSVQSALDKA